jgi:U3 small nucleolar RNA-associated protein 5
MFKALMSKRYSERNGVAVRTAVEGNPGMDGEHVEGELDVNLAELTLGQRLTTLTGDTVSGDQSNSDDEALGTKQHAKTAGKDPSAVPSNSLARSLIQALHSSDTKLLEACLQHSDIQLIRNSVRRLPTQLALPLITACVERLSRGRGGNNLKRGGGASSQRGSTLITWVKTVLVFHSGYLMTVCLLRFQSLFSCLILFRCQTL